jgi:hypothetical protein
VSLTSSYEFTLPRGFVDGAGTVHRTGVMRLATARDELEPLRDPTVTGPDDPRLTILVLARVVEKLGDLDLINSAVIEGLFAVDLAFLQDFYGVIYFGTQEEYEALLAAQQQSRLVGERPTPVAAATPTAAGATDGGAPGGDPAEGAFRPDRPAVRASVEELPRAAP